MTMTEVSSPGPGATVQKPRFQSPTSPFFLGSNDDALERAQARAARAASLRRKSIVSVNPHLHPPSVDGEDGAGDPGLKRQQILELFQNCIKLASENKINQKNTWELGLIDHIHEIIKVEVESEENTNFQKASCTLEAGVKIYSLRVDSVHSEAFKVLGGINRAGNDSQQDGVVEDQDVDGGPEEGPSKKDMQKKLSPLSTLESSFEALNVKKFDVAFLVDPLYHQTSAQFDEGGAKGLLLNNLGVYGGCRVLFDSSEVPGKCISPNGQKNSSDKVDLSFARDCFEQMLSGVMEKKEITPTLREIVDLFEEQDRRPTDAPFAVEKPDQQTDPSCSADSFEADDSAPYDAWDLQPDDDDDAAVGFEDLNSGSLTISHEVVENEGFSGDPPDGVTEFEELESYLFLGLGYNGKYNTWAGPEHWKFRKPKASEGKDVEQNGSPVIAKKARNKKGVVDIDFSSSLDEKTTDIFAPPKNPKTLLLPASRAAGNFRLPEDCHYQPENLVKLFLLPDVMCIGRTQRKHSGDLRAGYDTCDPSTSWDNESGFDGLYDEADIHSDVEDASLVSQPRQVNKLEVQYDKTSKHVDVQLLKETLWHHIQEVPEIQEDPEEAISFKQILASFPADCRAAARIGDISPHLSFICLLHLANENGLVLRGCDDLGDVKVHLSSRESSSNGFA